MNEDHNQGFIALWRSLLGWEWYMDINTCRLFVHLLLTVQYAERRTRGRVIRRGQRLCSIQILASETGLSVQQVRTALEHLKSTGDVTSSASPQGTVITVKNYGKYQIPTNTSTSGQQTDNKRSNKRPTNGQQTTSNKENNIPPISPTGDVFAVYSAGDVALLAALNNFEEMRRKIKKPMTDTAKRRLLKNLDKLSKSPEGKVDLLDEAVLHCWQTVYPPKGEEKRSEYDDAI